MNDSGMNVLASMSSQIYGDPYKETWTVQFSMSAQGVTKPFPSFPVQCVAPGGAEEATARAAAQSAQRVTCVFRAGPSPTMTIYAQNFDLTGPVAMSGCASLKAVPGGPYNIVRGASVTLNGSKSKGPIKTYRWNLQPGDNCPEGVEPAQLEGKDPQGFQALCSLRGSLTVVGEDADDTDTQDFVVNVAPRKWKTDFATVREAPMSGAIDSEQLTLGKNRCAEDGAEPNHWIHHTAALTWEKDGYDVDQIKSGPFRGFWYVTAERLKVHRRPYINKSLLPRGEIYELNKASNAVDLNLLVQQIREHEKQHSELAKKRLEEADFDPALKIERMAYKDRAQLVQMADAMIGDADSQLADASGEQPVKNELAGIKAFQRGGKLIVPKFHGGGITTKYIESYAGLGDK